MMLEYCVMTMVVLGMLVSWLPRRERRTLCEMHAVTVTVMQGSCSALAYPSIIFLVNNRC